jgi:hypothetical protein
MQYGNYSKLTTEFAYVPDSPNVDIELVNLDDNLQDE